MIARPGFSDAVTARIVVRVPGRWLRLMSNNGWGREHHKWAPHRTDHYA